jgi:L-histidine N-alpha-methyltransferase
VNPTPRQSALAADVIAGLSARPYTLPPKWFYDETGSKLFDEITRAPEYYPTEAERGLLLSSGAEMVAGLDTLVEFGSGSSDKTTALLDAMAAQGTLLRYVPFDVSPEALRDAVNRLSERYPGLSVEPVVGDFDGELDGLAGEGRRLIAFLGGTIGNYEPDRRQDLLRRIVATMDADDRFLLGTDLVKDESRLVAAYDDAAGATAEFNRNVLNVINDELGADFPVDGFAHRAVWNEVDEWIEMHLVAIEALTVSIPGAGIEVRFEAGEHVRTEISAKFTLARLDNDLAAAGLKRQLTWTDGDFLVSLSALA